MITEMQSRSFSWKCPNFGGSPLSNRHPALAGQGLFPLWNSRGVRIRGKAEDFAAAGPPCGASDYLRTVQPRGYIGVFLSREVIKAEFAMPHKYLLKEFEEFARSAPNAEALMQHVSQRIHVH